MKHSLFLLLVCLGTSGCSLVTVPVKTAGKIVTTTVGTTGDIVTAPFDAVAGRGDDDKEREDRKDKKDD